jgi:hypothetical protein
LATHAARALRFAPLHHVGSLAACSACGDLIREHRGHVSGRCTMTDELDALLRSLRPVVTGQPGASR